MALVVSVNEVRGGPLRAQGAASHRCCKTRPAGRQPGRRTGTSTCQTRLALDLHGLMGQLTKIWGAGVGYFTVINWLFATAVLCMLLDPKVLPGMDAKLGLPGGFMTALFCVFLVT